MMTTKRFPFLVATLWLATLSSTGCSRTSEEPLYNRVHKQTTNGQPIGSGACTFSDRTLDGATDFDDVNDFLSDHIFPQVQQCNFGGLMDVLVGPPGTEDHTLTANGRQYQCKPETAVVSEHAQLDGRANGERNVNSSYRAVTKVVCSRLTEGGTAFDFSTGLSTVDPACASGDLADCQDPAEFGIMVSTFGLRAAANADSDGVCDPASPVDCSDEELINLCNQGNSAACFQPGFDEGTLKPCWPENADQGDPDSFEDDINSDTSQARCFRVGQDETALRSAAVEVMAFGGHNRGGQQVAGIFNFYEIGFGQLSYFGSSDDWEQRFTGDTDLASYKASLQDLHRGGDGKCGGCHPGGGLVMKELPSPWVHWEHFTVTPGAGAIRDSYRQGFGDNDFFDGAALETLVNTGNKQFNRAKIRRLARKGDLKTLLRPLFCSQEFNFGSNGDAGFAPGGPGVVADPSEQPMFLQSNNFVDPMFSSGFFGSGSPQISKTDYEASIGQNGIDQQMDGFPDQNDTFFAFTFLERAGIDKDYIGVFDASPLNPGTSLTRPTSLIGSGIVSASFARKVLSTDLANPTWSNHRCALLDSLPDTLGELALVEGSPDGLSDPALAAQIELQTLSAVNGLCPAGAAEDSAACHLKHMLTGDQLLDNAQDFGPQTFREAEIELAVARYGARCAVRGQNPADNFPTDLMRVTHSVIDSIQGVSFNSFPFIEHPGLMLPFSDVVSSEAIRFDPMTCEVPDGNPSGAAPFAGFEEEFCKSPSTPDPTGTRPNRFGAWCYDPFVDENGVSSLPAGVEEVPASRIWVSCGRDDAQVRAIDSQCFSGCRRMRLGKPDECQPGFQAGFEQCQNGVATVSGGFIGGGNVHSFCDGDGNGFAAGTDRFACGEFGGASRMWCAGSCSGDFVDDDGNFHDVDGDGVMHATCGNEPPPPHDPAGDPAG